MRISDWSSDVCSSDLRLDQFLAVRLDRAQGRGHHLERHPQRHVLPHQRGQAMLDLGLIFFLLFLDPLLARLQLLMPRLQLSRPAIRLPLPTVQQPFDALADGCQQGDGPCEYSRSEEHTSELQSLMRLSYAVF